MALNVTPQQQETIAALYAAFWNRAPDSEGFGNYCTLLASGTMTAEQIATEMRLSAEGRAAYPLWSTNAELVTEVYQNLFDRAPDASGFAAWLNWLNANNDFPALVVAMAEAAINADGIDGQLFDNKIEVGIYVATVLESNNALVTTTAFQGLTYETSSVAEVEARLYEIQNTYTLTTEPDTATAVNFFAPKAYTPGGTDLVNTLQNEDVLTGDTSGPTGTYLYADLGNPNDSGGEIIAPSITDVETIDVAFTTTTRAMTLDFQDISGTNEANMVRISADLRQSFTNMDGEEVLTLGVADTSETAKATFTYLNNSLAANNNEIDVNLDNVSLAYADPAEATAALKINATTARGSEHQHQVEVFNINTDGGASTVATFSTGVSSFDDLTVGERPQTVNIAAGADLSIGTLRWTGARVETNSANIFQVNNGHLVGVNGLGFTDNSQINAVGVSGDANVTLANVGTWETEVDADTNVDFTLNAALQTGNLTADLTNAAQSVDAVVQGGFGSDRFYVAGGANYNSSGSITSYTAANVSAQISGGALVDTLTVQSNNGAAVDLFTGSAGMEVLNLVAGASAAAGSWTTDLTDGGFSTVTFNNQSTAALQTNTLTNLNGQTLSVRSTGLTAAGDLATTLQAGEVIQFAQAATVVGGTINLELGHASNDRPETDAFSYNNYTSAVSIIDQATSTNEAASLNLVVNTAGALGAGQANITVASDDFETTTTVTSEVAATNLLTVGGVVYTSATESTSSDYSAVGTNSLASSTYDGSAYAGSQNVLFGATTRKSHNITTGSGSDVVDLSYLITAVSTPQTAANYAIDLNLLNTVIDMGTGTEDELVLSATLADPRLVLSADPTYDGYFANWSGIEELTFNNRNGASVSVGLSTYVALDAYAQANNAGLNEIDFNDVNGTLVQGFRFNNDLTVNVDASDVVTTKTSTFNSYNTADLTVNVDASAGIASGAGNLLNFVSTGSNLGNQVNVNYINIDNSGANIGSTEIVVTAGSLDTVTFTGNLGSTTAASGSITVTAQDSWTAAGETTTYDFSDIINTLGTSADAVVSFSGALEGADADSIGLTIFGSNNNIDTATYGVDNTIVGSQDNDFITSGGENDTLTGGNGNDVITYNAATTASIVNTVSITGDGSTSGATGNDTIIVVATSNDTANITAGGGNDVLTIGNEINNITFADTNISSTITTTSTAGQMSVNVGTDTISSYVVGTVAGVGADQFILDQTVFGTLIGSTGTLASTNFGLVSATNVAVGAITDEGILVVQSGTNQAASVYYVDQSVTAGSTTVDNLVATGHATLIANVTSVTGLFDAAEFTIVA